MSRQALGKGLGALIPQVATQAQAPGLLEVEISKIKPNPQQPRETFDEEKLSQLASSIQTKGIIQPLLVQKVGDDYQLVAGERRLKAASMAGLVKVPVVVLDKLTREEILELTLIENLQREDLNPIELAKGYKRLVEEYNLTAERIGERVGKDRSSVSNTLRLLNLPEEIQTLIQNNSLSEGHGRTLLAVPNKKRQTSLANRAAELFWSVRNLERIVYKKTEKPKIKLTLKKGLSPAYLKIEDELKRYFGTQVKIVPQGNQGKIEIRYFSEEDLNRILEKLNIVI